MTSIKSSFLVLSATVAFLVASAAGALGQTASFNFDDGTAPADQGSYPAGATFTLAISLTFAPGGNVSNLDGLSYWFEQQSPLAPFNFAITNRDASASQFNDLNTRNLTYPQSLNPSNSKDLGGITDGNSAGAGTYFIANVTFSISPSAAPGTYILENPTSGGKAAVISDSMGHVANISHTSYTVTVVPFTIAVLASSGSITLQCQGVPNMVNRIEASPDLSPGSFNTLTSVTPDQTGAFSYPDMSAGATRFYRLAYP
jgi:hypothetical protein